ncbi:homocysteine S-methyltransferase family protein [Dongia rigui]|uniref:Homocysteine S-methyltransferase family protein n=1 Tax=Dongia rigui TaxID=940149 RepID=A0ABU5DUK3_9PROT|nr:homocysteine S-methyltransferase family protein [Dongia rigui]MDY0870990.1 homocysteine S-methyltransferase family protein [Dongia rigui]
MGEIRILDGGMGRQLAKIGAPFRMPEWSALALIEAPDFVEEAHRQFIASGAQIITTNSYSILPHQIGDAYFAANGQRLADLAGHLARRAAGQNVLVAGSLPPLFGSYKPQNFDALRAPAILKLLIDGLAPHVDHWLVETQSSVDEMRAAVAALAGSTKPIWVSYTLKDEIGRAQPPELRSGEAVAAAAYAAVEAGAVAVLFNCSQPEVMAPAIRAAAETLKSFGRGDVAIGVYANTFEAEEASDAAYAGISKLRQDVGPQRYLDLVKIWIESGATIIGGCCGIGPEHIAAIAAHVGRDAA